MGLETLDFFLEFRVLEDVQTSGLALHRVFLLLQLLGLVFEEGVQIVTCVGLVFEVVVIEFDLSVGLSVLLHFILYRQVFEHQHF